MRTVGEILRQERQKQDKKIVDLAKKIKVREEYLRALEKDDYRAIPGGIPIVTGILSAYSQALELDTTKMTAIFRRDYEGNPTSVLPKELQEENNSWTPAHTVGAITIILIILAGFFYYSRSFLLDGAPVLKLRSPREGEIIIGQEVIVEGRVKRGDVVAVNGEKILLEENGSFQTIIDCQQGENLLLIEAGNPKGEQERLARRFVCQEE
ncbi:MAG: XRE family transcriptional regulator [Microgenomates bacterium 39_6]|nr:MAG: XRE family transcriptional regulator [Microgenomates bacterium 39_6]